MTRLVCALLTVLIITPATADSGTPIDLILQHIIRRDRTVQTTCKWCQNHFPEEEVKTHEANCAVNPDVQEKVRKIGEIEKYVKTAVIHEGKIVRLYWAHSTGP